MSQINIWHIDTKEWPSIRLWRIDDENFQVNEKGIASAILTNATYSIIDQKYAPLLSKISDQVTFHKIKIFDSVLKTTYHNYIELNIQNSIDTDNIQHQNSDGLKIWKYAGEIFVSGKLKNELLKINPDDFLFSLGFEFFG